MKNLMLLSALIFIISSCSKDDPGQPKDAIKISSSDSDFSVSEDLLQLEDIAQFYRDDEADFSIKTDHGVLITAEPGSFVYDDDNEPVTGEIDFKVIELFTKSDIMRFGIHTKTDTDEILVSEGELYLEARTDSRKLKLAPGKKLRVRVPDNDPLNETQLFFGTENSFTVGESWVVADSSSSVSLNEWPVNDDIWDVGYDAFLDKLGWVNYDYFLGQEDLRKIIVSLPDGYSFSDTHVWVFFDDLAVALNMAWDPLEGFFAYIPAQTSLTIVAIHTKNGNDFEFAELSRTILVDETLSMVLNPMDRNKIIERLREIEK